MKKNIKNLEIIKNCYDEAIKLLLNNSTDIGIVASAPQERAVQRNYLSVFARDASICALGMVASKNKKLIKTAKKSLEVLVRYQAFNGQIPNYVRHKDRYSDFWRIECIDATLWWLVAIDFFDKNANEKVKLKKKYAKQIKKAIFWLECQEHVLDGLVMQNEASDWADLFPRTGKVLYSNALWCRIKQIYNVRAKDDTVKNFNNLFFPFDDNMKNVPKCEKSTVLSIRKKRKTKYYLSFVNYLFWGEDIDVYGNALTVIFDLPKKSLQKTIVEYLQNHKREKELPMPALFNPIEKDSPNWRKYMESHNQNMPYQYHNGGIWPYISCFWVIALAKSNNKQIAWQELEKIAIANKRSDWRFSEWIHAKTGKLYGMRGQSWNAGMFVLAYEYLNKNIEI